MSDSLCSYGWQELLGIMISVCMGFLYMEKSHFLSLQWYMKSGKLIYLRDSFSIVHFLDGYRLRTLTHIIPYFR
jgi:hypothetical protein